MSHGGAVELFSRAARARALSFLFVAGGAAGILTLLFPHVGGVDEPPLFGLAALAIAVGVLMWARSRSVRQTELHAAVAAGTLILAAGNYLADAALYPIVFSWTALYAFTCFRLRPALAHMALIAASYTVVLALHPVPNPVTRWLLAMGTPLVAGLLISRLLDRIAQNAAEAEARRRAVEESEERTRAIVEAAPNPFATMRADGTVVQWNRQAERVFGIPAAEALGCDVGDLMFAPEDRPAHRESRHRDLERLGPEPARREAELVRRSGERFPAQVTVSRVVGEGESLLVFFVEDLSERRRQEREGEALIREQAARQDAEQMAALVHGLQLLLDAALAHNRLDEMLQALLPRVCQVLSAEAATILLAQEDRSLVVAASTAQAGDEPVRVPLGAGVSGEVAERAEPLLIQDPPHDRAVDPAMHGMGSILSVPMLAQGIVTGVIQVGVPAPRRFDEEDLLLLGLAADRVALAIDHVRIYEREHRIAETLQRSLLPDRLPELPGLEVAARYLAAASEAEVGGDWYDVIPVDSGRVGLVMGDVAGKGLTAASMVGRLRSAMRAYVLEGHDPPTVVTRLNELIWSESHDTQMATLVYLVVDQDTDRITWVNAGHLPPLVLDGDEARYLEGPSSVPLGVMPYATYEQGSQELPAGATVLLYTDGLVERAGELLDDGLDRLASALRDAPGGPERLCAQALDEMVPGGAPSDDVALLALHSPALPERLDLTLPADPTELATMRAVLRRWLTHRAGGEEAAAEILMATGEAVANAIEHGTAGQGKPLGLTGEVVNGSVEVTVRNPGGWRPEDPQRGGGRGLELMKALMDSVEISPGDGATTVRMRRRLGTDGAGG